MKILYIDACVRDCSRTRELAEHLLSRLSGDITRLMLDGADIRSIDAADITARDCGAEYTKIYARQFAEADIIVMAAPYWDMSFPALLKEYIENICVSEATFRYENDRPVGLCKAKGLYYVTTAGGPFVPDFGYNYVAALANSFFGITYTRCFVADRLDMYGNDTEAILWAAKKEIDEAKLI